MSTEQEKTPEKPPEKPENKIYPCGCVYGLHWCQKHEWALSTDDDPPPWRI